MIPRRESYYNRRCITLGDHVVSVTSIPRMSLTIVTDYESLFTSALSSTSRWNRERVIAKRTTRQISNIDHTCGKSRSRRTVPSLIVPTYTRIHVHRGQGFVRESWKNRRCILRHVYYDSSNELFYEVEKIFFNSASPSPRLYDLFIKDPPVLRLTEDSDKEATNFQLTSMSLASCSHGKNHGVTTVGSTRTAIANVTTTTETVTTVTLGSCTRRHFTFPRARRD